MKAFLGFFAVAGLLAGASSARADQWQKQYSVNGRPSLHLDVSDGDVQIQPGAAGELSVQVTSRRLTIANDVRLDESQSGNQINITIRPRPFHSWFHWSINSDMQVTIHVPAEADLDIQSGDGDITSAAVSGNISFASSDGNLIADGLKGSLQLHSSDGHIQARNIDGSLNADTGDGNLDLQGRFDGLNVHTGDGSVTVDAAPNSRPRSDGWMLKSGDGSLTLIVPADFRANLEARTGDGSIRIDFPITVSGSLSQTSMKGQLNGGGPPVVLHTGDGSIRVEKQ